MVSTLHMGMALVRSAFLHLYVCSYHLTYSDQIYVVVYVGVGRLFVCLGWPVCLHLITQ